MGFRPRRLITARFLYDELEKVLPEVDKNMLPRLIQILYEQSTLHANLFRGESEYLMWLSYVADGVLEDREKR